MKTISFALMLVGLALPNCASDNAADEPADQEESKTAAAVGAEPPGPCRERVENADGEVTEVRRLSYDEQGRLVEKRVDRGADDSTDKIERKVYEGGKLVREIFERPDGSREQPRTLEHIYGDSGRRVRTEEDFRGGPEADAVTRYSYDEQGRLVREAVDFDRDGEPDEVFVQAFDGEGRLARRARYEGPPDAQEEAEWVQTFEYDEQGRRVARLEDSDVDGEIDVRVGFDYDAQGNRVEKRTDFVAEPGVDERVVFERTYDDRGRQVRVEQYFVRGDSRRLMRATEFVYQCE